MANNPFIASEPKDSSNTSWGNRADLAIAHGALTNSKRPACLVKGVYPTHLVSGKGVEVKDTTGKTYVDFICGLGTNLLGYGDPEIAAVISERANHGACLSLGTTLEVLAAEKLKELFPYLDRVRFLKTGSDACAAAIRIARAYHGVSRDSQALYGVLGNKEYTRVPQEFVDSGWLSIAMQGVCEEVPKPAARDGNKEKSTTQVQSYAPWPSLRTETLPKKMGAGSDVGQGQDLLPSPTPAQQEALRSVFLARLSGSSRGLREAVGSALALSNSSRGTPQKAGVKVLVLSEGYHGHDDVFVGLTPPHLGTVSDPYVLPLNGNEDLIPMAAAVIVEPVITDCSTDRIARLVYLRAQCDEHGALLIFDEVITGFRHPRLSAMNHYGVKADLSCFGKAMGNGMPIAAVGGPVAIMEGADYFVSSSYAGETLSLAAALKTMTLLQTKYDIQHLWEKGERFQAQFNKLYPEALTIEGYGTRGVFKGNDMTRALFFQESCKAGMLFGPSFFVAFPHMALFDQILENCRDILLRIKLGMCRLEGEMPSTPYAQKVRNQ